MSLTCLRQSAATGLSALLLLAACATPPPSLPERPSAPSSELSVGKVEPVEDAQLLPFGSGCGGLVVAQGLRIVAGFVESRTFGERSTHVSCNVPPKSSFSSTWCPSRRATSARRNICWPAP